VLPFINATKDPEIEYLCDGLAEALTDQLSRLPEFRKVIAFNGVLQFKGKEISPLEVGKQLGVDALLMTRLHKQGERLMLNMELIDARENSHIWSGHYEERADQISSVPQTVFLSLASDLHWATPAVSAEQARPTTANSEAYRLYLLGRHYYHKFHAEDLRQAARYFQESAEMDPTFALAFTGIAEMYVQRSGVDFPWSQVRDSAYGAAHKALELDSQLAQAYGVLGLMQLVDFDLKGGERSLLQALAINSSYSEGCHYYAHILVYRRMFDRGIAMMQRALELEPLSAFNQNCLANSYEEAGRLDEAVIAYERVREMDSTMGSHCYSGLCHVAIDRGEFDKARDYAGRAARYHDTPPWTLEWSLASINAAAGRRTDALRYLDQVMDSLRNMHPPGQVDPMIPASVHARLGDKEEALSWIEKAYDQRSDSFLLINVTREFDILRDNPRFIALLHKGGFVD
jgi:TolB-like protein/cation transport regulator ChaC